MDTCQYCGQSAGFLRKQHGQCRDLHATGIREMTQLAAQAAGTSGFNEAALRNTLAAIAARGQATDDEISATIAAGWTQGVQHTMSDGILTRDAEMNLRDFRDRMADQDLPSVVTPSATLGPGVHRPHRCPGPERRPRWRGRRSGRPSRNWITPSGGPAHRTRTGGSS